ncbi:MAG TPA: DUF1080 domain-containing protein [Vicinamibacteria bacterium]|nr:DUF1080 domain-containing protein [Vicinamibacteria bacterium]
MIRLLVASVGVVLLTASAFPVPATAVAQAPAPVAPTVERVTFPPIPLREAPALLESSPGGWTSVQPGPDLAGWTRGAWPATAALGPQQWSVDPATGNLVCDGKGGHEWLRLDRELGDAAFHVEWRFAPVEGADKYNSGVFARTAKDLSVWHQAQVALKGGFLFGLTPIGGAVKRFGQDAAAPRVRPAGEWNVYEVVARGRTLSLWVNGAFTGEIAVDVPRGHLGLEAEGWRIEFRNLKVKPLE